MLFGRRFCFDDASSFPEFDVIYFSYNLNEFNNFLRSPGPHLLDRLGVDTPMMSSVYKERFPKAKQQMENRLLQFLSQNAPLSGFTSQLLQLNIVPPSPAINTNTGVLF
jgi:hypothetical protein